MKEPHILLDVRLFRGLMGFYKLVPNTDSACFPFIPLKTDPVLPLPHVIIRWLFQLGLEIIGNG